MEKEPEIWKEIPNAKFYAVSTHGRIKRLQHTKWCQVNNGYSLFTDKILALNFNNSKGYGRVRITYLDGTKKQCSIHRLQLETFEPRPDSEQLQGNHKDGNKRNNYWSADPLKTNLEWCTNAENTKHKIEVLGYNHALCMQGEKCNFTKLTENQVRQIPELLKTYKLAEIAAMLGVGKTTICEIKQGRSWRHLNLFPKPLNHDNTQ